MNTSSQFTIHSAKLKVLVFALNCALCTVHCALPLYAGAGETTAQFLRLGAGARATGLGEAYSALADEASALYWNPAALKNIDHASLTLMHAVYIEDTFFDYAAYGHNLGKIGALGVGFQYLNAGDIPETAQGGAALGSFTPHDLAVSVGYAQTVMGFSLGISGKYIQSKITESATAGAVDLGLLTPRYFQEKVRFAATVTNLGSQMKFESENEDLPLSGRLGSALKLSDSWQWGLDVVLPRDSKAHVALGTEYQIPVKDGIGLALRGGFNSRTIGDIDGVSGVTGGLGFAFQKLSLDYAFVPFGSVGLTHRVSVSLKF